MFISSTMQSIQPTDVMLFILSMQDFLFLSIFSFSHWQNHQISCSVSSSYKHHCPLNCKHSKSDSSMPQSEVLDSKVLARVQAVSTQLEGVRAHLAPLLKLPVQSTLASMQPMDRARLQVAIGFAINALMFIYLKTKGENPTDHPVKKELDRVRLYLKKIKSTEATIKENQRKKEEKALRGTLHVDAPVTASIAFHDVKSTEVVKRTVERTLGIKRKKGDEVSKSSSSSSSSSSGGSSKKKTKRTTKSTKKKKRR